MLEASTKDKRQIVSKPNFFFKKYKFFLEPSRFHIPVLEEVRDPEVVLAGADVFIEVSDLEEVLLALSTELLLLLSELVAVPVYSNVLL